VSDIIKDNWKILVLGSVIGFLFIYPHLLLRTADRAYFKGVDALGSDAETYYLSRIREVYDGYPGLGSVYLWEGKNLPYAQPPLPEIIIALTGKFFGVGAVVMNILAKFFLGFLLSLIIYFFVLELFSDKRLALLSVLFILLASALTSLPDIRSVFSLEIKNMEFLRYARPVNPSLSSVFMFGYLLSFLRLTKGRDEKLNMAICSILLGLSFYVYVFTWTYIFLTNAVFCLWHLYRKNYGAVKRIFFISFVAVMIALPYFYFGYVLSQHPWYGPLWERYGFFESHKPILSKLGFLGLLSFVFSYHSFTALKRDRERFPEANPYLGLMFLSALLVINQQVITGLYIANDHYHWYVVTPLAGLLILVSFYYYVERRLGERARDIMLVILSCLFLFTGFIVQNKSYFSQRNTFLRQQRMASVFQWLNNNAPKDSVVFASEELSSLIPAYTSSNVYYSLYSVAYLTPPERLKHNYFLQILVRGVSGKDVLSYLLEHKDSTAVYLFNLKYRYSNGCSSCFPEEINEELAREYSEFSRKDFLALLKEYRVDYIAWDKKENYDWKLPANSLKTVFEADDAVIYEVL